MAVVRVSNKQIRQLRTTMGVPAGRCFPDGVRLSVHAELMSAAECRSTNKFCEHCSHLWLNGNATPRSSFKKGGCSFLSFHFSHPTEPSVALRSTPPTLVPDSNRTTSWETRTAKLASSRLRCTSGVICFGSTLLAYLVNSESQRAFKILCRNLQTLG